jgi:hypothetical protein
MLFVAPGACNGENSVRYAGGDEVRQCIQTMHRAVDCLLAASEKQGISIMMESIICHLPDGLYGHASTTPGSADDVANDDRRGAVLALRSNYCMKENPVAGKYAASAPRLMAVTIGSGGTSAAPSP